MTARDALHQACYVGMATEVEAEFRINAFRAEVLREAAEIADQAGAVYAGRGDNDRASAAFALMEQLKDMADAATPTSKEPQR